MLDLTRFIQNEPAIVPVLDGWGQFGGRKIYQPKLENGWYKFILGDKAVLERKATQLEIYKTLSAQKHYRVYALGTEGVPCNFDIFHKQGLGESVIVNFLDLPVFNIAKIVYWEDKRFYFYESETRTEPFVRRAQEKFRDNGYLSEVQGTTPELRYYFILCNLQRDSAQFADDLKRFTISDVERDKRINAYKRGFTGRLVESILHAGGTYVSHERKANGYLVTWTIGGSTLKSEIRDDLRIINAGFCLSGYDKEHSMNSIVNLAKLYIEDDTLNITRE